MDVELIDYLGVWLMIAFGVVPAVMAYRWILRKQYLPYEERMGGRLLRYGVIGAFAAVILHVLIQLTFFGGLHAMLAGIGARGQELLGVLIETLLKGLIFYRLVVWRRHYINRYDFTLYAVSLGLGFGLAHVFLTALNASVDTPVWQNWAQGLMQMAYQLPMGYCLSCFVQSKKEPLRKIGWLALAVALPALLQYDYQSAVVKGGPLAGWGQAAMEVVLLALGVLFIHRQAANNATLAGVDGAALIESEQGKPTLRQRVSYWFDSLMSKGNVAMVGIVFAVCVVLIVSIAGLVYWKAPKVINGKLGSAVWLIAMRMLDGGNVSPDIATRNPLFITMTLFSTLLGMLGFSSLVGIVGNIINTKLELLQKGHAKVLERGHVLFLGYSEQALAVLEHLLYIRPGRRRLTILLMAELPKEELERLIALRFPVRNGFKLICRSGDIGDLSALENVSLKKAGQVIISGDDQKSLACAVAVEHLLTAAQVQMPVFVLLEQPGGPLAAARFLAKSFQVLYARELSFAPIVRALADKDFIAAYSEMTSPSRQNVLVSERVSEAVGQPFYDALSHLRYSSAFGVFAQGTAVLNPPPGYVIGPQDEIVLFKGQKRRPGFFAQRLPSALPAQTLPSEEKLPVGNILIIGNGARARLLEQIQKSGHQAKVHLLEHYDTQAIEQRLRETAFDLVVCLAQDGVQGADAHMLPYLLFIYEYLRGRDTYVCAALTQSQHIRYVYQHGIVDYVLEDERGRQVAAQIQEETSRIKAIEEALFFSPQGLRFLPARTLAAAGAASVATLARQLTAQHIILLGYLKKGHDGKRAVVMNPSKNEQIVFGENDRLIVI